MKQKTQSDRLRSTPGMWILFCIILIAALALSILCIELILQKATGKTLPTRIFTSGNHVVSIKLPNNWVMVDSESESDIVISSPTGQESIAVAKSSRNNLKTAYAMFRLELNDAFPDLSGSDIVFEEKTVGSVKMYWSEIEYRGALYVCGVKDAKDCVVKFVYMVDEPDNVRSDLETIVASINYRQKLTADGGVSDE